MEPLRLLCLATTGALVFASGAAMAEAPPPPPDPAPVVPAPPAAPTPSLMTGMQPVKLDLGIATELPIMVIGAATLLEVPYGIQLRVDVGYLGTPYTDAINSFLSAIGAYGSGQSATATSELIGAALHNSLVFRGGAGWRPFSTHGFEFFAGYSLVTLGGSLSGKEAVTAVTGRTFPNDSTRSADVTIQSTLHNFNVGFGWRWLFVHDHLVLRTSAEYLQTLASSTSLSLQTNQGSAALTNVSSSLNSYLDGIYRTYVKTPVISLGLAYRF